MLKKLIACCILALTVQLSYSQRIYPSLLVIDRDTIVGVTVSQAQRINAQHVKLMQLREDRAKLQAIVDTCSGLVSSQLSQIETKESELIIDSVSLALGNGIMTDLNTQINRINKSNKIIKFERNFLFYICLGLGGFLLLK